MKNRKLVLLLVFAVLLMYLQPFQVFAATVPAAPSNVNASATATSLKVTWSSVSGAIGYTVSVNGQRKTASSSVNSMDYTSLVPGKSYDYAVCANNSAGSGSFSTTKSVTTNRLSVPTGISTTKTWNTIALSWAAVPEATEYEVSINGDVHITSNTFLSHDGMTPNTDNAYSIRARVLSEGGYYYGDKATGSVRTDSAPILTPAAPSNVSASATVTSIRVTWSSVSGATGYTVTVNGQRKTASASQNSMDYTGLVPGKSYDYAVCATNSAGSGSFSTTKSVTTNRLSVPTGISTTKTSNTITLSWAAVPEATEYEVSINGDVHITSNTFLSHDGMTPNTDNAYSIRARVISEGSYYYSDKAAGSVRTNPANVNVRDYIKSITNLTDSDITGQGTAISVLGQPISIEGMTFDTTANANYAQPEKIKSALANKFNVQVRKYLEGIVCAGIGIGYANNKVTLNGIELNISSLINMEGTAYTTSEANILNAVKDKFPNNISNNKLVRAEPKITVSGITGNSVTVSTVYPYPGDGNNHFQFHNLSTGAWTQFVSSEGYGLSKSYVIGSLTPDTDYTIDLNYYEDKQWKSVSTKIHTGTNVRDYIKKITNLTDSDITGQGTAVSVLGQSISIEGIAFDTGANANYAQPEKIKSALANKFNVQVRKYLEGIVCPGITIGYANNKVTLNKIELNIASLINIEGTTYTTSEANILNAVKEKFKDNILNDKLVRAEPKITVSDITGNSVTVSTVYPYPGNGNNHFQYRNMTTGVWTTFVSNDGYGLSKSYVIGSLTPDTDYAFDLNYYEDQQWKSVSTKIHTSTNVRDYIKKIANLTDNDITGQGTAVSVLGQPITIEGIAFDTVANANYAQSEKIKSELINKFNVNVRKYLEGIICSGMVIGYANNKVTLNKIELNISSLINIEGTTYTTSEANILSAVKEKFPNNISNNKLVRAEPKITVSDITGNSVTVSTVYPYPGNGNNHFQFHNLTTGVWTQFVSGDGYGLNKSYVIGGLTPNTDYTIDLNYYEDQKWNCVSTKIHTASTPTVTLTGTKSLTILKGQSANLQGLITSSANIEKVTIGVKEVNLDCYESIVPNSTLFDLNSFKIDTIKALTPSGSNNPFVNMGSYTLTVWAKIAGSDAIKLGEISLNINVAGIGNRAARTNLMKLVSIYPSIFKYNMEINDTFDDYLNGCLLDFASKYNLTGSYSRIEELEDKLQQAADGILPLPGIGNRAARTNLVKLVSLYPSMFKYSLGIDDTFDGYLNSCLADFAGKFELSGKYTKIEELEFYLQQAADGKIKPNSGGDSTYWRQKIVDEAGYWINKISYQMPSPYDYKTGLLDKNSPPSSLDCSDFTSALYATVLGTRFVDYTGNQLNVGTAVDMTKAKSGDYSALKPGDLIIFDWPTNGTTQDGDHVAVYVGGSKDPNGKVYPEGAYIHESSGAGSVAQATLSADWGEKYGVVHTNIIGIRRVIQDDNTYINNPSDGAKALPGSGTKYTYIDKDGNKVTKDWTISDDDFVNVNSLTQAQITNICKSKNSALINKGVDTAIYRVCQDKGINPKVILATLGQEQSWGLNGSYDKLFGIGPEGKPISYSNIEWQIAGCADIYLKYYNIAKSLIQKNGKLGPQTKNIDDTGAYAEYEATHPVYGEYMIKGQQITSVNAAMYSKLTYTPWVDFPPQNSHPLDDWLNIYNSLK